MLTEPLIQQLNGLRLHGMATADALLRIEHGTLAAEAGGRGEYDNGNGSLMRIIPVALRFANLPTKA